jgi:B12-binding domain/radical SAM domain protein
MLSHGGPLMSLRVLAFTAPQFVRGEVGDMALTSGDAASLHNACRYAAWLAENGDPVWSESNWNCSRVRRRESTLLFHDMTYAAQVLPEMLIRLRPNLVLIGAMTICMPGAIAAARIVRSYLGDDVLIVLGGRHANETMYLTDGEISHHRASPLALAERGAIEDLFDVVISGDGEAIIAELGRAVVTAERGGRTARSAQSRLGDTTLAKGEWIAGALVDGRVHCVWGAAGPLNYSEMPSPAEMFGVGARFSVFGGVPTAHVFSDIGRGCVYDCAWCSERHTVVGPPRDFRHSAARLHRNLKAACSVIRADSPGELGASAFCEDSTLLGWNRQLIGSFCKMSDTCDLDIRFGGQATIDQILRSPDLAANLHEAGLDYIYVGVESPDPDAVGGFSKDVGHKKATWLDRGTKAFDILQAANIQVGVSLLFGLGETPQQRQTLFSAIARWREVCTLDTISMNWAVRHPLQGHDGNGEFDYLDWAIEDGPLLSPLRNFGESSTKYPVKGGTVPILAEVEEIIAAVRALSTTPAYGH